jgi:ribonucleoside-diphosphate reductase alpha chain
MLDNVVEINGLPIQAQRDEIIAKRRHGMGFLGLGSALTLLGMRYDSPQALSFASEVSKVLAVEGWRVGLELAKEKGCAPILADYSHVSLEMLRLQPRLALDGYKAGDIIPNAELHANYSSYMARIRQVDPELVDELARVGARFTHHTSIAPTGTISLSLANNASNGIEPSFAHHYSRNIIREGRKTKEKVSVYSYELLAYRTHVNPDAMPDDPENGLPDCFISADSISPRAHIDMQAACQPWIDSAISKTVNVATDCPFEDFKSLYLYASQSGLKGCTTFRFNPVAFQGVLVKESDLAATTYRFELEDGSLVECRGNDLIDYDGAVHSAANLFDALKEGRYQLAG